MLLKLRIEDVPTAEQGRGCAIFSVQPHQQHQADGSEDGELQRGSRKAAEEIHLIPNNPSMKAPMLLLRDVSGLPTIP